MSVSARKRAANRANAQKSRGPVTEAGKAAVSQNRTVHGLAGRFKVLACENQDEFDAFLDQLIEDEKPVGLAEVELVKKMAEHTWLAKRALRIQDVMFGIDEQTPEQKAAGDFVIHVRKDLEVYIRYHAAHDRAYQRAASELLKRRAERLKAQRGFESQKRAEAEEIRKAELHPHKVRTAHSRADHAESRAIVSAIAAADKMCAAMPPPDAIANLKERKIAA
jgi:hypothetical protein